MKAVRNLLLVVGMYFSLNLLHAQTALAGSFNGVATPVQAGVLALSSTNISLISSLSDEQLTALVNALDATPTIPASALPIGATCWSLQQPNFPPLPGDTIGVSAWPLGDGSFLLADGDYRYTAASATSLAAGPMQMSAMESGVSMPPGFGDLGSGGTYPSISTPYVWNTNLLWLQISNVIGGTAYASLFNGTDEVYSVWSTTNLLTPFSLWQVETEVFPTASTTNCMPFTVSTLGRQNLFLRAQDWTGVTENGNQTPEWWFWLYYGNAGLALSDTSLDSGGNTLLYDYQNGMDPDIILFTVAATNNYLSSAKAALQLNVTAGTPAYEAIAINSTNLTNVNWVSYGSSNLVVNLGGAQGWQSLWVGLRGPAPNATPTWRWKHLNVSGPPMLVITNPASPVLNVPLVQIYGYSQKPLASLSCGVSNALGVAANLPCEVTDQYYDTNAAHFTTNYFECLDVPLTNGLNVITFTATDLAGDATVTNFNFSVNYSSKTPAAVQMTWPLNGMAIAGNTVTLRGQVDDPTVTVMATVTGTNGGTSSAAGVVERNGRFWIQNVPLNSGSNMVSITLNNIINQSTVTNLTLVQSPLKLTINPPTGTSLWGLNVTVGGTVSDSSQTVWVNGVAATVTPDGSDPGGAWVATNVPTTSSGVASFMATAYPAGQAPSGNAAQGQSASSSQTQSANFANPQSPGSASVSTDVDKPWRLYISSFAESASGTLPGIDNQTWPAGPAGGAGYYDETYLDTASESINYNDNQNNSASFFEYVSLASSDLDPEFTIEDGVATAVLTDSLSISGGPSTDFSTSPTTGTEITTGSFTSTVVESPTNWNATATDSGAGMGISVTSEFCDIAVPMVNYSYSYSYAAVGDDYQGNGVETYRRTAQIHWKLETGGLAIAGLRNLFAFSGGASTWSPILGMSSPYVLAGFGTAIGTYFVPFESPANEPLSDILPFGPGQAVSIGSLGTVGSDGMLYTTLPNGVTADATPTLAGSDAYVISSPGAQKYHLTIAASTNSAPPIDLTTNNPLFCVGQQVTFTASFDSPPPTANIDNLWWHLPATFVNQQTNYSPTCTTYVLNNNLVAANPMPCWFVTGGGGACSFRETLNFPNGQIVNLAASGNFTVYRPSVILFTNYPPFTPVVTNGWLELGDDTFLSSSANNYNGIMNFIATVKSTNFPGDVEWTQLNDRLVLNVIGQSTLGYELDNDECFSGTVLVNPANSINFVDCPGIATSYSAYLNIVDQYNTYLRFTPNTPGSIWVTLGIVDWGWSAEELGGAIINTPVVIPPAYTDSDVFPVWSDVTHSSPGT